MTVHVLVGSGHFALGFAADLFSRVGELSTVVLTRERGRAGSAPRNIRLAEDLHYRVRYEDTPNDNEVSISISGVENIDFENTQIIKAVCDPELEYVTVCVPEGALSSASRLLLPSIYYRYKNKLQHPLVLAFVNTFGNSQLVYAEICHLASDQYDDKFNDWLAAQSGNYPVCVVDRICNNIEIDPNDGICVSAERHASFFLSKKVINEGFKELGVKWNTEFGKEVLFAVEDIRPCEARKYWGVNGIHLLLGGFAMSPRYRERYADNDGNVLISELVLDSEVEHFLRAYLAEVITAIRLQWPDSFNESESKQFVLDTLSRIRQSKDTAKRLLHSLRLRTGFSADLLATLRIRLGSTEDLLFVARTVLDQAIRDFLNKLSDRLLDPTMYLLDHHDLYPLHLGLGATRALNAIVLDARDDT